LYIIKLHFLN